MGSEIWRWFGARRRGRAGLASTPARLLGLALLAMLCAAGAAPPAGARPLSAVVPGAARADATFDHIGVVWAISGDDNRNSAFALEFRAVGEQQWRAGAPAMRATPTIRVEDGPLGLNSWAASAMFLRPGQSYELRLTLTDPDGGGAVRTITAATRAEPQPDPQSRLRYVAPGAGGGDGSQANPFRGMQAAAATAQPGDLFLLAGGTYAPFQLLASGAPGRPIVIRGAGDQPAILDGGGTDRGVVTLGESNQTIGHVILERLVIRNGAWGIDAQHSHDIVIRRNQLANVGFGVINRRESGLEYNQTVCDNAITGRTAWPGTGIPPERGIDLRGTGNIVCANTVRNFGDCISVQPLTSPSYGNDIFGNDAAFCVDDGIEIDYNQANARVWRNRVTNARMGVSVQPIRGGPAYILRNELFNLESNPLKMHNYTTGYYVLHNTAAKHGNGQGDDGAMWRNAVFRNNLMLGTRYAFEFTTVPDEGTRDLDYNAWGTTHAAGSPGDPDFKWNNVRYQRLADLPPPVEAHGRTASFAQLANAALPAAWNAAVTPGSRDLRLLPGAPAINAGQQLPNINDPFVSDGQPDMGAFELGQPLPPYGPRPERPDLQQSRKQAGASAPRSGATFTYTITLRNTGAPAASAALSDTIPAGLSYVPGSLRATSGTVDAGAAPLLRWSGALGSAEPVVVQYRVTVTASAVQPIRNLASVAAGPEAAVRLESLIIANGSRHYLPLARR
ncbi:MAG TPA: right-handed parallel beta-helix repeat-containing protein [Herpetosiphonaceae bacterium]